jgi:hypothetical protein
VKHAVIGAVLSLSLAAPAAADDTDTRVVPRWWTVQVNGGPKQRVEDGATFRHCPGDDVDRIVFRGRMTHPSRRGVDYDVDWRHRGEYIGSILTSTGKHGNIHLSFVSELGGFGNGEWSLVFKRDGKRIGKSAIRLRTASGPDC